MYSMMIIVNCIIYFKDAKRVHLKFSYHKKETMII